MPDFLTQVAAPNPGIVPLELGLRLLTALALGGIVAWIYRRTRRHSEVAGSLPATLVLLTILVAMVTQVIGDSVARAFSLVGALSIVRFRTIVRDTQDTAYVIFAVVVGMAVGARSLWVAVLGIAVVGLAAVLMMKSRISFFQQGAPAFVLRLRAGVGHDLDILCKGVFDVHLQECELVSIGTTKQGIAVDATYHTRLRPEASADILVKALNRLEGVQSVQLERQGWDQD
jgi:hypothetical protein